LSAAFLSCCLRQCAPGRVARFARVLPTCSALQPGPCRDPKATIECDGDAPGATGGHHTILEATFFSLPVCYRGSCIDFSGVIYSVVEIFGRSEEAVLLGALGRPPARRGPRSTAPQGGRLRPREAATGAWDLLVTHGRVWTAPPAPCDACGPGLHLGFRGWAQRART
jgi:hypothetical protein